MRAQTCAENNSLQLQLYINQKSLGDEKKGKKILPAKTKHGDKDL